MTTLEDVLAAVHGLHAKLDALNAAQAISPAAKAAMPAGDLLPGSITVPVPAPDSHVRYRVSLGPDAGKAVEVIVGELGVQGFTWTYNEADPSGRSALIGLRLENPQGAVVQDWGSASTPGNSSFAADKQDAAPWQPRVAPGRYMLVISANVPALIDFEFH